MTRSTHRRLRSSTASAAATALVFTAALWMQHARSAWPFDRPASHPAAGARGGGDAGAGAAAHARVAVSAAAAGSLDIRLERVARVPLARTIRAVATIVPDESRISHVHTRVAGWVEQLDVNTTGERVRAGQPLARIFSQELLSSQVEYLAARRHTAAAGITSAVIAGGRSRLEVLGMAPAEIDAIERSGEPRRLVTVVAPRGGVVVDRGVTAGTSVDPSTTLLTIADLSRVWVLAEVPEGSMPGVEVGTAVQLEFPASGRPPFAARAEFVYPMLSERTRTLRVRMSASNASGALRPGLFGTAVFRTPASDVIAVPREAVVDTGAEQHVFVAAGDRFEPRIVRLGGQDRERVEVREGLAEGERIVASGVFLLDSESRLRATGGAGGAHNHGSPSDARQPPAEGRGQDRVREPSAGAPAPANPHAGHGGPPPAAADPHAGHRE
jgi:Cu(I)/Ag(I) efflux system membrane fusion protein